MDPATLQLPNVEYFLFRLENQWIGGTWDCPSAIWMRSGCAYVFINMACYDKLTDMSSALVIESFCEHCDLYWSFHSYIIITV
jgi:hypothetical protein